MYLCFQQFQDILIREHEHRLTNVHDHANGWQGGLKILRVRRPNRNWHGANVKATIKRAYQVGTGGEYQRNVVPGIDPSTI